MKNKELNISDDSGSLDFITVESDNQFYIDVFVFDDNVYCLNQDEIKELRDYLNSVLGDK